MAVYLLLIVPLLFPYLAVGSILGCMYTDVGIAFVEHWLDGNIFVLLFFILIAWVCALLLSVIGTAVAYRRRPALEIARMNFILKCLHIPAYVFIFFVAAFTFVHVPFFFGLVALIGFLIDAMTIIPSGVIGLGALVKARKERAFSAPAAVFLSIAQFLFCADLVCAAAVFFRLRKKNRRSLREP